MLINTRIDENVLQEIDNQFVECELDSLNITDCLEYSSPSEVETIIKKIKKYINVNGSIELVFINYDRFLLAAQKSEKNLLSELLNDFNGLKCLHKIDFIVETLEKNNFNIDIFYLVNQGKYHRCCVKGIKNA